jgi:hypothetical protein
VNLLGVGVKTGLTGEDRSRIPARTAGLSADDARGGQIRGNQDVFVARTPVKNSARGHQSFITEVSRELHGSCFHGILVSISGHTPTRDSFERCRRSIPLFGTELAEQDGYSALVVRHAE